MDWPTLVTKRAVFFQTSMCRLIRELIGIPRYARVGLMGNPSDGFHGKARCWADRLGLILGVMFFQDVRGHYAHTTLQNELHSFTHSFEG